MIALISIANIENAEHLGFKIISTPSYITPKRMICSVKGQTLFGAIGLKINQFNNIINYLG